MNHRRDTRISPVNLRPRVDFANIVKYPAMMYMNVERNDIIMPSVRETRRASRPGANPDGRRQSREFRSPHRQPARRIESLKIREDNAIPHVKINAPRFRDTINLIKISALKPDIEIKSNSSLILEGIIDKASRDPRLYRNFYSRDIGRISCCSRLLPYNYGRTSEYIVLFVECHHFIPRAAYYVGECNHSIFK